MAAFKLSQKFLGNYEGEQPNWGFGDLSYFVYKRTYARQMCSKCMVNDPHYALKNGDDKVCYKCKHKGTAVNEEYFDTCRRVTEATFDTQRKHCGQNRLPWNAHKAQKTAQEFFRRMWQFKFTPPGRGFWIMGTRMVDKVGSAALQNCGFTSTRDVKIELGNSFAWAMDMLMLGVGVGFDTEGAGTVVIKAPKKDTIVFQIPDSREGWVESLRLLMNSYQTGGNVVIFDYSLIRLRGEPIRGFGGTASGPEPLRLLHENIRAILGGLDGKVLTSVAIVDLFNFIGKCVVAGNVRRSAELAIGKIDDVDYISMKDYKLHPFELRDRRWASNNSVFAEPWSDFSIVSPNIALNGEPGLIFLDNARHFGRMKDGWISFDSERYDNVDGFNPCAEQCLEDKELCCLVETFPANHENVEDYLITLKFAYMYAKTITLIPTHDERTNSVMMRNRRIGCSMSGIQQAIKKFGLNTFLHEFCDKGYEIIRHWDRIYSRWLGVPRSIRMTTVKPSGTVSILAGATPGVHFTHSEFYMRTVRISGSSNLLDALVKANYRIEFVDTDRQKLKEILIDAGYQDCAFKEESKEFREEAFEEIVDEFISGEQKDSWVFNKFAKSGGTFVVYFPVKEKNFTKSKFDVSLWEQLAVVREMQYYWSDNAVSCTVTIQEHEKEQLNSAIEYYAPYVKTLSFLPLKDHKYVQAPYIECTADEYSRYAKTLSPLDLNTTDAVMPEGANYCTNDTCSI